MTRKRLRFPMYFKLLVGCLLLAGTVMAQSARDLYRQGRKAEERGELARAL